MGKLDGKVALITGGSSGIGLAAALLLAKEGAQVVIAARNPSNGEEAAALVRATGEQAMFVGCDVRQSEDCRRAVDFTMATYGRLDVLFNNAGVIYVDRTVVTTTDEEWAATIDSNLTGSYLMSKWAVPVMAAGGGGSIIHNASVFGLVGGAGVAAYCAAKGGVILLTKAMALDHAAQNIRVNCICPGSVDTPMLREEMRVLGGEDVQRAKFAARHPLNRISTPEEIAQTVLFLACSDSSFITGAAIPIDGGRSAW